MENLRTYGKSPFIMETRLSRLNVKERKEALALSESFSSHRSSNEDRNKFLERFGEIFTKADAYNPITLDTEVIEHQYDLYDKIWKEAREFRASGKLLELGQQIRCPVTAIHGDYDPHPAAGIQKPLSVVVKAFHFILLKNCGHLPWIESEAKERFFEILREELGGINALT